MSILNLTNEESNYEVLNRLIPFLHHNIRKEVEDFINSKKPIDNEINKLRIKARAGNNQAALKLMQKLAQMKDGP